MRSGTKPAARPAGMTMAEPSPEEVIEARKRAVSDRPPALHLDLPAAAGQPHASDLPLWTTVALGLVLIAGVIAYALM